MRDAFRLILSPEAQVGYFARPSRGKSPPLSRKTRGIYKKHVDFLSRNHEFSERHFSLPSNDRSIERRRVDFPFHLVAVAYRYGPW